MSFCLVADAETINEKYSYRDFMHKSFKDVKAEEFNNSVIVGSCFYQEGTKRIEIFPKLENVEFRRCNLDNVKLKGTNLTLTEGTTNKKIKAKDGVDWIYDEDDNPIEPLNPEEPE